MGKSYVAVTPAFPIVADRGAMFRQQIQPFCAGMLDVGEDAMYTQNLTRHGIASCSMGYFKQRN